MGTITTALGPADLRAAVPAVLIVCACVAWDCQPDALFAGSDSFVGQCKSDTSS
jgi:hypothetical protein